MMVSQPYLAIPPAFIGIPFVAGTSEADPGTAAFTNAGSSGPYLVPILWPPSLVDPAQPWCQPGWAGRNSLAPSRYRCRPVRE